nr:PREDICTED: LOW QUALITY PROTEIN: PRAME family member 12 [Bos mutus]
MSIQTPPRLLDLVGMHLLRHDDLAFSTLESLPTELFPPFAWKPSMEDLEALDVLLAQKVRYRRCKLRVLDLRNIGQNFWSMWSGASSCGCSSSGMALMTEPRSMTKQHLAPLKIFMDLCLKKKTLDNFLTFFLWWVEQRKSSIHLCCKKLMVVSTPVDNIVKVLSMVQLDCIQEVQKQEQDYLPVQITSQFLRLGHLQDLHLESPSFLEGCLDQMLRCLKFPLDSLSRTSCWLIESHLTSLSQSPNIKQLKGLDLSGVTMTDFRPELHQVLLEKVAATLQEVDLDACGITDSQLEAFLPALSHCSQLRAVSLCGNLLSTDVMEKLLRHTAVLSCLRPERYPAPQESYRPRGVLLEARLAQLRAQLLEILRDLGRPSIVWISPSPCPRCELFSPLFRKAFERRCIETLKVMVQA